MRQPCTFFPIIVIFPIDALQWSQRGVAAYLGLADTRARRWASGELEIPPNVAAWLERLAAVHEAHPMPEEWKRR